VPDGSQWLASGTLYSKNMLISGKNRAVASTYFKADATAPKDWMHEVSAHAHDQK
jgi:hypothetical protein